jgi:hypothetical protein
MITKPKAYTTKTNKAVPTKTASYSRLFCENVNPRDGVRNFEADICVLDTVMPPMLASSCNQAFIDHLNLDKEHSATQNFDYPQKRHYLYNTFNSVLVGCNTTGDEDGEQTIREDWFSADSIEDRLDASNIFRNQTHRLPRCKWHLGKQPDIFGRRVVGIPSLTLITPEGDLLYPQDLKYYPSAVDWADLEDDEDF